MALLVALLVDWIRYYHIDDAARIACDIIKMIISAVVEGCLTDWIWIVFECGVSRRCGGVGEPAISGHGAALKEPVISGIGEVRAKSKKESMLICAMLNHKDTALSTTIIWTRI